MFPYLSKISSNQQQQPEHTFIMVRMSASTVTVDTANKTAER